MSWLFSVRKRRREEGPMSVPYWQTEANYIASGILKSKAVPSPMWCLPPLLVWAALV